MSALYDTIGTGYTATRAADPRITGRLLELLDLQRGSKILDIGAGTGNYSDALAEEGFVVAALEPSKTMREQGKQHERLSWFDGVAENLPFVDARFDGVVMTLSMHHFSDWRLALTEAHRVLGRGPIVILTFDAEFDSPFWLFEYFPAFLEKDREWFPKLKELERFGHDTLKRKTTIDRFALPSDLKDHFASAGWARPEIYLDANYRSGISSFSSVDPAKIAAGLAQLDKDLKSGEWDSKYGELRTRASMDVGYVFIKMK